MAKMVDVAKQAGVSIATAYKVFNGSDTVSAETSARVLSAANELEFTPNGGTAPDTKGIIAYVYGFSSVSIYFHSMILELLTQNLQSRGWKLVIWPVDAEDKESSIQLLKRIHVKGIIYQPKEEDMVPEALLEMSKRGIPILQLFSRKLQNADAIKINDTQAVYRATGELLSRGFRRILMLEPWKYDNVAITTFDSGYIRAHEKRGLPNPEGNIFRFTYSDHIKHIIKEKVQKSGCDAILSISEKVNVSVLQSLNELHYTIPDDISMIAYDDSPWLEACRITAVSHPFDRIVNMIADLITDAIHCKQNGIARSCSEYVIDPVLISRRSVGQSKNVQLAGEGRDATNPHASIGLR